MSSASVATRSSLLLPGPPFSSFGWPGTFPSRLTFSLFLCPFSPLLNCFAVDLTAVINDLGGEENK